jgi:hypothetical protein
VAEFIALNTLLVTEQDEFYFRFEIYTDERAVLGVPGASKQNRDAGHSVNSLESVSADKDQPAQP